MDYLKNQTINITCIVVLVSMTIGLFTIPPYGIQIILSPLGIAIILIIAILFFLYSNIIFLCLFLLIVYVFFLKYSSIYNNEFIQYTTKQSERDIEMDKMKGQTIVTLEENIINTQNKPLITHNGTVSFEPLSTSRK